MGMEQLVEQRIQLSKILGKGLSNDGSVPTVWRGIEFAESSLKKETNDGSKVSQIKAFEKRNRNFSDFTLQIDGEYYVFGGDYLSKTDDTISLTPIVRYAKKKNIITTPVNQIDEVIEQWSMTGYTINVSGLLVDVVKHQYPQREIQNLKKLFDIFKTATVTGDLFIDLGINELYIHDLEVEPLVGFPDTAFFRFQAKSIRPLLFTLTP